MSGTTCAKITFPFRDENDEVLCGYTNAAFYIQKAEEYAKVLLDWKVEMVDYDESFKSLDSGLANHKLDSHLKPEEWITYNLQVAFSDHEGDIVCEGGLEAVKRRLDQENDEGGVE